MYDMQLKNLQALLEMKELVGEVVLRADIFYALRKIAVIQQQIAEINLEKEKNHETPTMKPSVRQSPLPEPS